MILYFVLVGFVTGAIGAVTVVASGGGVLLAILAYSFAGGLGVVLTALVVALAPAFPRPRPGGGGGLPASARSMSARSVPARSIPAHRVASRPAATRHARLHANANATRR